MIIKFFISSIIPIVGFFTIRSLAESNVRFLTKRNVLLLLFMTMITMLGYTTKYNVVTPLLSFLSSIFVYKEIFKTTPSKMIVACAIMMITMFIIELLLSAVIVQFVTPEVIRTNPLVMTGTNTLVGLLIYGVLNIKFVHNRVIYIVNKKTSRKLVTTIFLIVLLLLYIIMLYDFTSNPEFSIDFAINVVVAIIFLLLSIMFGVEEFRYDNLIQKYDTLMEHVQTFEEYIEKEQLNLHEYKNQLAAIETIANSKQVSTYIKKILNTKCEKKVEWTKEFKNLPKCAIKGLLYYKAIIAVNNGINVLISISPKVTKYISKLTVDENKTISQLSGIYFDNAIEATRDTKEKNLSLEAYIINGNIRIVISNSVKGIIDVEKLNENGYTTKGVGRGRGLYFANKLLKQNRFLKASSNIVNGYYVQILEILAK